MKNITKIIALAVVILGFSANSFGQLTNSATATATGSIVAALTIEKTGTDMNFGSIIPGASGGSVILIPAGTSTVTGTVVKAAGTITAAVFSVVGTPNSVFTISLPASGYEITRGGGTEKMTVNTFTSNPTPTGNTGVTGTVGLTVGATLIVGVSTANPAGVYTGTAPFTVTVNYN